MDTKLHKLFDDTRHEGKNEMDFLTTELASPSATTVNPSFGAPSHSPCGSAADPSSDMSISDDSSSVSSVDDCAVDSPDGQDDSPCGDSDWEDESMSDDDAEYLEEDDDEINMAAYDTANVENNGLCKTEQAGVVHLVHGWTQRGHPNEVC